MKLIPYVMFPGTAEEALNFYKECLHGEVPYMGRYGEAPMDSPSDQKDKIMHATFIFDGNTIMVSDAMPGHSASEAVPGNIQLSVDFTDAEEMGKVFEKISGGGNITMPLQDTFWGARFGMFTDKFGVKWMFNHDKKPAEN